MLDDGHPDGLDDAFEFFGRSEGEREVLAAAIEIMGSQQCARAWLRAECTDFGDQPPQAHATTREGQARVLALLAAIANGYEV